MLRSIGPLAIALAVTATFAVAQAHDESKYPDWAGQWRRPPGVNNQWDTTKPRYKEEPPLTPSWRKEGTGQRGLTDAASLTSERGGLWPVMAM